MRVRPAFLLALACLIASGALRAQPAAASRAAAFIEQGTEAYAEGRYEDALRAFEAAVDADPADAEAHYLLARVLFDTPLRDEARAGREIRRARALDPENLQYMVAELQQLRTDTWNFVQEMLRQRQRLDLAQKILERDPDNSFAHEEFGTYYIRDFWKYRNAVSVSDVAFASGAPDGSTARAYRNATIESVGEVNVPGEGSEDIPDIREQIIRDPFVFEGAPSASGGTALDPDRIATGDRFDLGLLEAQGVPIHDLSARADAAYARAIGHLEAAVEADPRRRPVYTHLMRLYALADRWEEALSKLSPMLVFFPDDVEMWRFFGLTNHRVGREDAAAVAFDEALGRMAAEQRAVFEDVGLLLPDAEQAAYRADPETVARRFWTSEKPRFLTPYNERRLEHYARLTYADLMYRSDDLDLAGWDTQRGRIHVRYGLPRTDVVIRGDYQNILEGYLGRAEGFVPNEMAAEANAFNIWDYGDFKFVFEDPGMTGEFRLYSPPADLFAATGAGAVDRNDYVLNAARTFRETPQRYEYDAPGRLVELPYLVTAFKGDAGRTDLYVHYGIPIADGFDPETDDVVDVTVKTGAFLISAERDLLVERRRTLYGLNANQVESFAEVQLWTDTQPMAAAPGPHTVSVEFETAGGATAAVQRREIAVPDFSGSGLALSSLMLAYLVEEGEAERLPGRVVRSGLVIEPAPWSVFSRAQPIYLYFEAYNLGLAGGRSDYEVEAELRPKDTSTGLARLARSVFGGGERGVSTRYPVQGDRADDGQYVILDAADQEPGLYTLTLRIHDRVSGRTVEETTDLFLE
jgi:GWxTD domain-containing protein